MERLRPEMKSKIEFNNIPFQPASDQEITDAFIADEEEIKDRDAWVEKHKTILEKEADSINKAVEEGLIPDARPKSVWAYQKERLGRKKIESIKLKQEIESQ